jgi:hypothetical protein
MLGGVEAGWNQRRSSHHPRSLLFGWWRVTNHDGRSFARGYFIRAKWCFAWPTSLGILRHLGGGVWRVKMFLLPRAYCFRAKSGNIQRERGGPCVAQIYPRERRRTNEIYEKNFLFFDMDFKSFYWSLRNRSLPLKRPLVIKYVGCGREETVAGCWRSVWSVGKKGQTANYMGSRDIFISSLQNQGVSQHLHWFGGPAQNCCGAGRLVASGRGREKTTTGNFGHGACARPSDAGRVFCPLHGERSLILERACSLGGGHRTLCVKTCACARVWDT